ncbi:hypothetical protein GCM10017562_02490 [Streptomyces roseofulvus]
MPLRGKADTRSALGRVAARADRRHSSRERVPGEEGILAAADESAGRVGKFMSSTTTQVSAVQVLIRVEARHPARPLTLLHQVMAVMDAWRGDNWWAAWWAPWRTVRRPYSSVGWRPGSREPPRPGRTKPRRALRPKPRPSGSGTGTGTVSGAGAGAGAGASARARPAATPTLTSGRQIGR